MNATEITCVWPAECTLGEGPVWDQVRERLWFVDIKERVLLGCDEHGQARSRLNLEELTSAVAPIAGSLDLLATSPSGIYRLNPSTGARTPIAAMEPDRPDNRPNDAKVDPWGTFWVGTMNEPNHAALTGCLYRLDPKSGLHQRVDQVGISNGLDWSPDGKTFYFTDSIRFQIWAFDHDPATGALTNKRIFSDVDPIKGAPDGLTVDAEGCVWSARWDGFAIVRHAPDGKMLSKHQVPVEKVTSLAFGGQDNATLFITTASQDMGPDAKAEYPFAGGLFACRPGVAGQPPRAAVLD